MSWLDGHRREDEGKAVWDPVPTCPFCPPTLRKRSGYPAFFPPIHDSVRVGPLFGPVEDGGSRARARHQVGVALSRPVIFGIRVVKEVEVVAVVVGD